MSKPINPRVTAEIMASRLPAMRFIEELRSVTSVNVAYDNIICALIWFYDATVEDGTSDPEVEEFIATFSTGIRDAVADVRKGRAALAALAAAETKGTS